MKEVAARIGVTIERSAAVDAREPANNPLIERISKFTHMGRNLTKAEAACFLSHRDVWREFVSSGDDWIAVLEDDVHFGQDFSAVLDAGWLPPDVAVIRLETVTPYRTRISVANRPGPSGRRLHRATAMQFGSAGYLVSRKGAEHLMALSEITAGPLDHFLFDPRYPVKKARLVYQLVPAPIIQEMTLARLEKRPAGLVSSISEPAPIKERKGVGYQMNRIRRLVLRKVYLFQHRSGLYPPWSERIGPEVPVPFK